MGRTAGSHSAWEGCTEHAQRGDPKEATRAIPFMPKHRLGSRGPSTQSRAETGARGLVARVGAETEASEGQIRSWGPSGLKLEGSARQNGAEPKKAKALTWK